MIAKHLGGELISEVTNVDLNPDMALLMLKGQWGFNSHLRDIIRTKLFPKVKFISRYHDLSYSSDTRSISASIFEWMGLQGRDTELKMMLWTQFHGHVIKYITQHRNNVIKRFKKVGKRKYYTCL